MKTCAGNGCSKFSYKGKICEEIFFLQNYRNLRPIYQLKFVLASLKRILLPTL